MFEAIFENIKFMDKGAQQGIIFAIGIGVYYMYKTLSSRNR